MSVGMVIMRPTSIVVAGGGTETASIRAAGGVEFSAATSLSLNGVFTADFDDYMISLRCTTSSAAVALFFRMRASGTDNSTASSYTSQYLEAGGTTVSAARPAADYGQLGTVSSTARNGQTIFMYGPNLSQPTAARGIDASGVSSAYIVDRAVTHNQSTSYDGITLYLSSGTLTGLVTVYGLAQ